VAYRFGESGRDLLPKHQGRSDGGISGYIPPNQSTLNFLCGCFVSLTQDKFDIVQFIPTQIKLLATPLLSTQ